MSRLANTASMPYWRLSSFYFFYFALVGALNPYLGLYLTDIGFDAYAVGLVGAVLMGTKIVAPNLWGWLCDYTSHRIRIIILGSFLSALFFAGVFFWQTLVAILVITFLYSFFWNAILSQFDTVTIQYLNKESHRYSQIRLWGSVGFIIAVVALGIFFDMFSIQYLIPISWVLLVFIGFTCLTIKEPLKSAPIKEVSHWSTILKKPAVLSFFIAASLLQFGFGAYYMFFSLYLETYDYSRTTIGLLWALGVMAEVILFACMHHLMPRIGVARLLFISLLLTGIRWLVTAAFAENIGIIIVAQCIHAFSFGAAHAASIELIRIFFKGKHMGQGNALYSSITFGIGGALGAFVSGILWDVSPYLPYVASGIAVIVAAMVVWFGLCNKQLDIDY